MRADTAALLQVLEDPTFRPVLLGGYEGGYSVGVSDDPEYPLRTVVRLGLEGDRPEARRLVSFGGETIIVLEEGGLRMPRPPASYGESPGLTPIH